MSCALAGVLAFSASALTVYAQNDSGTAPLRVRKISTVRPEEPFSIAALQNESGAYSYQGLRGGMTLAEAEKALGYSLEVSPTFITIEEPAEEMRKDIDNREFLSMVPPKKESVVSLSGKDASVLLTFRYGKLFGVEFSVAAFKDETEFTAYADALKKELIAAFGEPDETVDNPPSTFGAITSKVTNASWNSKETDNGGRLQLQAATFEGNPAATQIVSLGVAYLNSAE